LRQKNCAKILEFSRVSSAAALMFTAIVLSSSPSHAEDKLSASAPSAPVETEHAVPLESALPCNAGDPPRAYTLKASAPGGVHVAILCEDGKYSAFTHTPPPIPVAKQTEVAE
jgi:hypothetical protein